MLKRLARDNGIDLISSAFMICVTFRLLKLTQYNIEIGRLQMGVLTSKLIIQRNHD